MTPLLRVEKLDRRVRIESRETDEAVDAAGSTEWVAVAETWAEVEDMLPSRGEKIAAGINVTTRPARVRMRWRTDITGAMRLAILRRVDGEWVVDRLMQIVSGPAELGRRDGIEMVAEEYTPGGNEA